jgi:hypothetical protein
VLVATAQVIPILILGLFNDTFSGSCQAYVASKCGIINEHWTGKKVSGSDRGLI